MVLFVVAAGTPAWQLIQLDVTLRQSDVVRGQATVMVMAQPPPDPR